MAIQFINATPHPIHLNDGRVFEPSDLIPRVDQAVSEFDADGIARQAFGEVTGLPEEQEGVKYIVSAMVLNASDRTDLVAPATNHKDTVRNEKGHIVSVPGFVAKAPKGVSPEQLDLPMVAVTMVGEDRLFEGTGKCPEGADVRTVQVDGRKEPTLAVVYRNDGSVAWSIVTSDVLDFHNGRDGVTAAQADTRKRHTIYVKPGFGLTMDIDARASDCAESITVGVQDIEYGDTMVTVYNADTREFVVQYYAEPEHSEKGQMTVVYNGMEGTVELK